MVARGAMINGFVFQWPAMFTLLLLVPVLVWLLGYARKQRLKLIDALGGGLTTHRRLRDVLRVLAFVLVVFALARPGHSPRSEPVSRYGRDVVFALDVSRSMLAEDARPSRLEVAKQGIRDALDDLGNERVGLVVYAGSASILCPLTYDYDFVRYMLEQAHPRSVDFGGTTLQAAVEKVVDQVFIEGREGVQDLVVLTDGGDHGSQMAKVVEILEAKQVDVLAVGLGDPHRGSPIPIADADGAAAFVERDGIRVTTKLEDEALRSFAANSSHADYVAVGVSPFDLGQLYRDYALNKQVVVAQSDTGVLIYQEAAVFFLVPAIVLLLLSECWGARGLQLGQAALWLAFVGLTPSSEAADTQFRAEFDAAVQLFERASFEDAELQFATLYGDASEASANPADLAALQVNRGLCLVELAKVQAAQNPAVALSYAEAAQLAFLSAKRYAPDLDRAGLRLQSTAALLVELEEQIEEQREAEDELNEAMQALIEQLQALLEAQTKLRHTCDASDVNRRPRKPKGQPAPAVVAPQTAPENAKQFVSRQLELLEEAQRAEKAMQEIDAQLSGGIPGVPAMDTILTEPLKFMQQVKAAQDQAAKHLAAWASWPAGRASQLSAEQTLQKILDLLAGDSQQHSEESDEWDEYEEEYDYEYMEDSDQDSMMSSDSMQGDFAAGGDMQELPVPNYSAEDILLEEQGSLQFRQQKRASANAAKVEKDY